MAEYDNTNSGALFENDDRKSDKHPHLRGSCTIKTPDGELVEYWVSAWQKTSKKGDDFFSLSFQVKDEKKEVKKAATTTKSGSLFKNRDEKPKTTIDDDLNDDVPF